MSEPVLKYEVVDHVGVMTLNRPEAMNSLSYELYMAIEDTVRGSTARALVLTGTGRCFCAGDDVKQILGGGVPPPPESIERSKRTGGLTPAADALLHTDIPVIAAVNGAAAGLGLVQALMCDMRFAADTAKFTVAFSKRGLIGEYGISWVLPRLVGHANAVDLMFSSRVVMADEALAMGMVNKVVPAAQLMDVVMAYAADLAMNVSPASMAVMKRQVYGDYDRSVSESTTEALRLMRESFGRPDFKEGVQSFLQKRQAAFPPVPPGI